eukprot:1156166-Pelagomonas_calceolata.AAC.7
MQLKRAIMAATTAGERPKLSSSGVAAVSADKLPKYSASARSAYVPRGAIIAGKRLSYMGEVPRVGLDGACLAQCCAHLRPLGNAGAHPTPSHRHPRHMDQYTQQFGLLSSRVFVIMRAG